MWWYEEEGKYLEELKEEVLHYLIEEELQEEET